MEGVKPALYDLVQEHRKRWISVDVFDGPPRFLTATDSSGSKYSVYESVYPKGFWGVLFDARRESLEDFFEARRKIVEDLREGRYNALRV